VNVRPATQGDVRRIAEVIMAAGWSRDGEPDPPESRWREVLADDSWWVGVADDGEGPVGVATVKPDDDAPATGHITYLVVAPEYAGQGVGRALLDAAADEMRRRGYERAHLRVGVANAHARRFYERNGWRDTGRREFNEELGFDLADYELLL
jgi:ribosomal protein S18 acetylase RimI-like enzyme